MALLNPLYTAPLPAGFISGTVEIKSPGTYVDQAGRVQQPSYRFAINADGSLTSLQVGGAPNIVGMGVGDRQAAPMVDIIIEIRVAGSPVPLRTTYQLSPLDSGGGTLRLQQEKQAAPTIVTASVLSNLANQTALYVMGTENIAIGATSLAVETFQPVAPAATAVTVSAAALTGSNSGLASAGLLAKFQSSTAAFPVTPTAQELTDYGVIAGYRTVNGLQQAVTYLRPSGPWQDSGPTSAAKAISYPTKAALSADTGLSNGLTAYTDGNLWEWLASGTANGGTIIPGANGGVRARKYVGIPDVRWWDSLPDSVMPRDNGPNIQAAINALGSGGALAFPAGQTFAVFTKVTVPFQFSFIGAGEDTSLIRLLDQSGEWFQVRTTAGVLFQGLGFKPPTDSLAMQGGSVISLRGTAAGSMNAGTRVRSCSFLSHFVGVDAIDAFGYVISDTKFNNLQTGGTSIRCNNTVQPDYGDWVIERCVFHAFAAGTNTRAIQQLAGGGGRVRNNKFYLHTYAYNMFLLTGVGTGILFIQDNSFETQGICALLFEIQGGSAATFFAKTIISTNQFNEDSQANIRIAGGNTIKMFTIIGNQFTLGASTIGVDLITGIIADITGNTFIRDAGTPGGTGINLGAGFTDERIGENFYHNVATPVNDLKGTAANLLKPVTLTAGWATSSVGAPLSAIKRLSAGGGYVHLSGCIAGPTTAGGTVMATLPTAFAPAQRHAALVYAQTNTGLVPAYIEVRPTGQIAIVTALAGTTVIELSLTGVAFPTA